MYEFYSTCPAGLEEGAARLLRQLRHAPEDVRMLGAALTYRQAQMRAPECEAFQNTYLIIKSAKGCADAQAAGVTMARDARALAFAADMMGKYRFRTFRVMFSNENQLAAPHQGARNAIERAIATAKVDRVKPDTEILILRRSEGVSYMLLRLTHRQDTHKTQAKGALSPHVCACLMALLQPRAGGVFLDPFAGSGALPKARAACGPYAKIYASDLGERETRALAQAMGSMKNARVFAEDALHMDEWLEKGRVTEVVTDPPWGLYRAMEGSADEFHRRLLEQLAWVCAAGARLVILTAARESFAAMLRENGAFALQEKFDCLISGKKASAFVMEKHQ